MLFSNRIASIPCSSRHSKSTSLKEFPNPLVSLTSSPIAPSLHYFNMRVTERLHRYRSLKRQWNEISTAIQIDSSLISKSESPLPITDDMLLTDEENIIKDDITSRTIKEKVSIELDPLHSRIENDLIKLRKLIKTRQKKSAENLSLKTNNNHRQSGETAAFDNQEQNNIKKILSLNRSNTFNCVKISGCQMRSSTFLQSDSTDNKIVNTSKSSSTCSQYSKQQQQQQIKQQNIKRIVNICRDRVHQSLPSDSLLQGVPLPKRKINTPPKTTSSTNVKQSQTYLPMPPIIKKEESNFIKEETPLPPIRRSSVTKQTTTCLYNYAASTSSAIPPSMKLNRSTSLLPILLTSSSCIGIQPRKTSSENCKENNDVSRNLLDYKHLINHLPKPIIPIVPRYDQGDYGHLFAQLDHIRETMPNSNVYENYTRIC